MAKIKTYNIVMTEDSGITAIAFTKKSWLGGKYNFINLKKKKDGKEERKG